VLERFPAPGRNALGVLVLVTLLGGLGALPGAAGALDPVTLLGWLALWAPAAGALCGAHGVRLFPFGLAVPGTWLLLVAALGADGQRGPATPLWAGAALGGLFALGVALGRLACGPAPRAEGFALLGGLALPTAGLALLGGLALALLPTGGGLLAGGAELARTHPRAAARLLDASPLVLVLDCAGWDWTHAHPELYARAGVEWFQRRPWPGNLAGPASLVVGCVLAGLARARRGAAAAP
jgi:hypothetical protein